MITQTEDGKIQVKTKIAIFTHDACTLKFDKKIKKNIRHIEIPPLPKTYSSEDFKTCSRLFLEKVKAAIAEQKIITLGFSEINGILMYGVKTQLEKHGVSLWFVLSFFDSDETIFHLGKKADALLEKKVNLIEKMLYFPFIKKLETPEDGIITGEYLHQLAHEFSVKYMEEDLML